MAFERIGRRSHLRRRLTPNDGLQIGVATGEPRWRLDAYPLENRKRIGPGADREMPYTNRPGA